MQSAPVLKINLENFTAVFEIQLHTTVLRQV